MSTFVKQNDVEEKITQSQLLIHRIYLDSGRLRATHAFGQRQSCATINVEFQIIRMSHDQMIPNRIHAHAHA